MIEVVYLLSAATVLACAIMLLRGYRRSGSRLLLRAALCFAGLTLNNCLLYVDVVVVPDVDLSVWRSAAALAGLSLLLYGLVWEENQS